MVTCQSANQLKTPEKDSWAFNMVSQFGSLGQATQSWERLMIWQLSRRQSLKPFTRRVSHKHSLPKKLSVHRVLYPSMLTGSWVEGKSVEGYTINRENRSLMSIFRLGSRHQEPPHTDVSMNLETVIVRGVLPGLRWRRTGLLPSGPKSSFQMRASFVFHLETKVLESGGRVEKLITQVAWSSVLSFHSLWWFGCNVICWCWSIVFFENQRHCTRLPINIGALHASFCWPAF